RIVIVLRFVVAAGEDHHRARAAVDVDLRRYRRGPRLTEARERRAVETPQELRSPRVRDVERVVSASAASQAEVEMDPLAVFAAQHLNAQVAVDAVMLRRD